MQQNTIIIIPTYNEAMNIESTIEAVFANTKTIQGFSINVLVFDSASTDETVAVVRRLMEKNSNLFLAQEPIKSGLGSAYLQAMRYAIKSLAADIIVEYDADGSHNPVYLAPMLMRIKNGADVVVGSRYVSGGSIPAEWGWHRKFLSGLGNVLARSVLSSKYRDYTSGFRVSRSACLNSMLEQGFLSNGYAYKLHVFFAQHLAGARIEEHPIKFVDRTLGASKLPRNSIIDSLRVLFALRFRQS